MMSSAVLLSLKRKALRKKVWFSVLSSVERGLLDSVVRAFDVVRSRLLATILGRIVAKLHDALESGFKRMVKTIGWELVKRRCLQAISLGCSEAHRWAGDKGFADYLTVVELNTPIAYRCGGD